MRSCKTASQRDQVKAPSAVDDPEVVDEESECRGPIRNRRPPTRWGYSQLGEGEHRSTVAYLINCFSRIYDWTGVKLNVFT